jgi:hypothetical protein
MANSTCTQFNPDIETIVEFIERFKVQCSDLLEKAGDDGLKKAAVLVKSLPVSVITDLQRRIKPVLLSAATYDILEGKLTAQYEIKKSIVGAAVKFLNRKQGSGESIENYAKIINDLASSCVYKDCCRDRLLRDAFVSGLYSSVILTGLLQDCENKSFNECVEKAKFLEQLTADAQDIKFEPNFHSTHSVQRPNNTFSKLPMGYICIRCGARAKHFAKQCFAVNTTCNQCGKIGHLAKMCKSGKNKSHAVYMGEEMMQSSCYKGGAEVHTETLAPANQEAARSHALTSHSAAAYQGAAHWHPPAYQGPATNHSQSSLSEQSAHCSHSHNNGGKPAATYNCDCDNFLG